MEKFVTLPNPKIRETSQEVVSFDGNLAKLIDNLIKISEVQKDPPALGMAAIQIGVPKRVFVALIRQKFKAFVNPRITKYSEKELPLIEGCFSVTGIYGQVTRPAEIDIEALDKQGKTFKLHLRGLAAKIVQHEVDHLDGKLFVDHVHDQNGKVFKVEKDQNGKEHFVEVPMV